MRARTLADFYRVRGSSPAARVEAVDERRRREVHLEQHRKVRLVKRRHPPDRHRADRVAVIRLGEADELVLLRPADVEPVLRRQLERDLRRGRAGVAVEDLRQTPAGRSSSTDRPAGSPARSPGRASCVCATLSSCARIASSISRHAVAVHVAPEATRRRRDSGCRRCRSGTSPRPPVITSGSDSSQSFIGVNGCQMCCLSRRRRSSVRWVMREPIVGATPASPSPVVSRARRGEACLARRMSRGCLSEPGDAGVAATGQNRATRGRRRYGLLDHHFIAHFQLQIVRRRSIVHRISNNPLLPMRARGLPGATSQ